MASPEKDAYVALMAARDPQVRELLEQGFEFVMNGLRAASAPPGLQAKTDRVHVRRLQQDDAQQDPGGRARWCPAASATLVGVAPSRARPAVPGRAGWRWPQDCSAPGCSARPHPPGRARARTPGRGVSAVVVAGIVELLDAAPDLIAFGAAARRRTAAGRGRGACSRRGAEQPPARGRRGDDGPGHRRSDRGLYRDRGGRAGERVPARSGARRPGADPAGRRRARRRAPRGRAPLDDRAARRRPAGRTRARPGAVADPADPRPAPSGRTLPPRGPGRAVARRRPRRGQRRRPARPARRRAGAQPARPAPARAPSSPRSCAPLARTPAPCHGRGRHRAMPGEDVRARSPGAAPPRTCSTARCARTCGWPAAGRPRRPDRRALRRAGLGAWLGRPARGARHSRRAARRRRCPAASASASGLPAR